MTRPSLSLAAVLALLAAACSDPKCPRDLIQEGAVCKRCPEGSEKQGNQCVDQDSGSAMDPVEVIDAGSTDDVQGYDASAEDTSSGEGTRDATAGEGDANLEQRNDSATPNASDDAGPPCYADSDGDGVGAGPAVSCTGYGTEAGAHLSLLDTDCDDNDPKRSPSLTDVCGDHIDNDCDRTPDDESNNACGGPCTTQLAHQPGEACDNGLVGACARAGTYICQGNTAVVCDAPQVLPSSEVCDGIDNNCNGAIDEPDALDATTWYQDCDGDGFAASTANSRTSCTKPENVGACGWTAVIPVPPPPGQSATPVNNSNWDCNDALPAYHSGANDFAVIGTGGGDLNCDGTVEKDPFYDPGAYANELTLWSNGKLPVCSYDPYVVNCVAQAPDCSRTSDDYKKVTVCFDGPACTNVDSWEYTLAQLCR